MTVLPPWVYTFIAVAVTCTWAGLNAADPFLPGYNVDPALHIVMGAVAGGAFGGRVIAKGQRVADAARDVREREIRDDEGLSDAEFERKHGYWR